MVAPFEQALAYAESFGRNKQTALIVMCNFGTFLCVTAMRIPGKKPGDKNKMLVVMQWQLDSGMIPRNDTAFEPASD